MKKVFFLLGFLSIFGFLKSQTIDFMAYEDSLNTYLNKIAMSKLDEEKKEVNKNVIRIFDRILQDDNSFEYPFDSIRFLGKMTSPNKLLRIYNWNLSYNDGTFEYFGYIQYYVKSKKKFVVYRLEDKARKEENPNKLMLTPDNWWGALYYEIIENKAGSRMYYTLLGWDGADMFTNKKVIETLYFTGSGVPKFGGAIIKANGKTYKRIVFEYSNRANMTLKYFEKNKRIVLDHLSPSKPEYEGMRQYYGPDFSYDAFVLKKGKWYFETDVDFRAPKNSFNKQTKPKKGL